MAIMKTVVATNGTASQVEATIADIINPTTALDAAGSWLRVGIYFLAQRALTR